MDAASVLVGMTRWPTKNLDDVKLFVRAIPGLVNSVMGSLAWMEDTREEMAELYGLSDSASAMFPGYPLVGELTKNDKELTIPKFRAACKRANDILEACRRLPEYAEKGGVVSRGKQFGKRFPELTIAFSDVMHRLIPGRAVSHQQPMAAKLDAPGWGDWHPVIRSFDDLLAWATADLLAKKQAANVGKCEYCGRFYFSKRPGRHRFCPDGKCKDLYWRKQTGPQRSKKARARRKARQQRPPR